jgi:hypothetical protein
MECNFYVEHKNEAPMGAIITLIFEKKRLQMAIVRVPITKFVAYMQSCLENKCGYIMGGVWPGPQEVGEGQLVVTQYTGEQRKKALYCGRMRPLVMDCNGLAEGGYQKETCVNINARARNNYSHGGNPKGPGTFPPPTRVCRAAAVFIHNGSYVSHVGFLWKPVTNSMPEGTGGHRGQGCYVRRCVHETERATCWNRWGTDDQVLRLYESGPG